MRALLLAALLPGAAAAYTTGGPPAALPDGMAFSSYGIGFTSYGIAFSSYGIGFPSSGLPDDLLALVAAPEPEPAPAPIAEGLAVTEEADGAVRYTLSADILFDFDSDALRPEARTALAALAGDVRARFADARVIVEGHTDGRGDDSYNQALSERRALSVESYLAADQGFDAGLVETVGLGETRPAAPNETPEGMDDPAGRQLNRRVEVLVREGG